MLSHQNFAAGGHFILNSFSKDCTHITSAVAFAKNLYSTYVLDQDIVPCFFACQETRLHPKNTAKPHVDFLSSMHPAQSASENALTRVEADL
jgi:hypothetical protein